MDQKIINLFDEYTHKPLKREDFLRRLAQITGSVAAAMTILPLLEANYAHAATVPDTFKGITAEDITYPGDNVTMKGYLVKPDNLKAGEKRGAVIVIHENRGLNPHIRDVARRVAAAGYIALAPDALSPFGGTPANEDEARGLFGKLDAKQNLNSFIKGFDYLKALPESNGKTAAVGFCWGGALTNQLAVNDPTLDAGAAFYGMQPAAADVPKIKARLQLHYGEKDERVNAGIAAYEEALKAANINYEVFIYGGAQHAFHNDTAGPRYDKASAEKAWARTLQLFKETIF
ncbi:dienelactone hydrolase family protein [Chitinophaga horti]|uniref:Dienelactone hydrolase family protein n=1 Tax=Chitinophaga horti TaxID=2920382 RepID=A0ABY6J2W9_9BACT|nr:dienelactone hydrolase family protein [Chitinophaga horti]UYQ94009.1 dienelactone hydrolase family protein [Chitinophaga horti]